ncbi:glycosyltransferase [Pseudokineococcus sp. 1T1Z-3]|uniref:glycosyltransferase n=1 Tax=Pseudokineococcus sp. 1T1Z-3 TaxID=3132745 RepID=UPI00309AEFC9
MSSAPTVRDGAVPALALLVSRYPALSHTFVEREVTALRELGCRVVTFTVRPPEAHEVRSEHARAERSRTTALVGAPAGHYVRAQLAAARRSPLGWLASVRRSVSRGPATLRGRLWQLFYLAEAGVLLESMRAADLTHVHVHLANSGADVARAAVDLGRATDPGRAWSWSLGMHGPTELEDVVGHDLPAKVASASAVACISDFCRSQLMRHSEQEVWPRLGLVRMGVDVDAYPGRADERAARAPGPLRVLFVGRLVPEKGPGVLLDALGRLVAQGVDVQCRVAGAGPLAGSLSTAVARGPLAGRVELLGPVGQDDMPALHAWADVFCLPSFAEGVPVVLMEAMSSELPVVSTRIAGIPELVEDGVTGRLVTPGRADLLAEAIASLTEEPLRHKLGRAGRERVVEEFQPLPNARRLLGLLHGSGALGLPPGEAPGLGGAAA